MRLRLDIRYVVLAGIFAVCIILTGCRFELGSHVRSRYRTNNLSLSIILQEQDRSNLSLNEGLITRQWISYGRWHPKPSSLYVTLEYVDEQSGERAYFHHLNKDSLSIVWPESARPGESLGLYFTGDLGEISFEGELGHGGYDNDVTAFGVAVIDCNRKAADTIGQAFGQELTLDVLINLIINDVTVERLIEFADCGVKFSVEQAGELSVTSYKAESVKKLIENGFTFDAEDIIKLAKRNVSADYAIGWKKAGYDLSIDKLIYAKQRNLSTDVAVDWNKAGCELSLEQLYWVKQRNIHPQAFIEWNNAGRELSLEQLYWVKQRNVQPQASVAWNNAGYKLSLEQLYWAKQRNLDPRQAIQWKDAEYELSLEQLYWVKQRNVKSREAAEWKKMRYDFSIEELYRLKQYNVSLSYGAAFADPEFEQPGAEQLIEFKRSNISPETIRALRKRKDE